VPAPAAPHQTSVPTAAFADIPLEPGWVECGLWWPPGELAVGDGQTRRCPVLVMVAGQSRHVSVRLLPTSRFSDVWIGHHQILQQWGVVPHTLHWDLAGIQDPWPLSWYPSGWSAYVAQAQLNDITVANRSGSRLATARRHLNTAFRSDWACVPTDDFTAVLQAWGDSANGSNDQRREREAARHNLLWADECRAMARNPRSPQVFDPAPNLRRRDTPDDRGQLDISGNAYQVGEWGVRRRLTIDLSDTTVTIRSSGYHAGGFHTLTYARSWAQNTLIRQPLRHIVIEHGTGARREIGSP